MAARVMEPQPCTRLHSPRGHTVPRGLNLRSAFASARLRETSIQRCAASASPYAAPMLGTDARHHSLTHSAILQSVMPFVMPAAAAISTATYAGVIPLDAGASWLRPLLVGLAPLLLHGVIPLLDFILGQDRHQPPPAAAQAPPAADDLASRLVPILAILAHLAVAAAAYVTVATAPLQPYMLPLLLYSIGTSAAMGMGAAHELVHSRNPLHLAATAAFLTLHWWYPYYRAHHQHHLHVCTPVDYTCAPEGLNVYSYLGQYITGSYAEAWQLSVRECDKIRKPRFGFHNSTLVALVAQALLTAVIYVVLGPLATALHLGASAILLSYMAIFDYVLHYGLVRPHNGRRYTPISPYSSWNSLYPLETGLLFNVLLHSDHHMTASKSYGWLRPHAAVPTSCLPTFPGPINLVALSVFVPPLWFALMDGRADEANAKHLEYTASQAAAAAAAPAAAAAQNSSGRNGAAPLPPDVTAAKEEEEACAEMEWASGGRGDGGGAAVSW